MQQQTSSPSAHEEMVRTPPRAPLAMPSQDFRKAFNDPEAPEKLSPIAYLRRRIAILICTLLITSFLSYEFHCILAQDGLTSADIIAIVAFTLSVIGITLGAVNASLGFGKLFFSPTVKGRSRTAKALDVALLIPAYNEEPDRIFGNAYAMLNAVKLTPSPHIFCLYILSDSTDAKIIAEEERAFAFVKSQLSPDCKLYYRRRENNFKKKAGNIDDWCQNWGAAHDAMIVLDADSLMNAETLNHLTDSLAEDGAIGLVQSVPRLINAKSIFGALQQFANAWYGRIFSSGFSVWCGDEGNYWGHNAIIRTRAFAASAGLPELKGPHPVGGEILSHDFVEAALLRRAGWKVRMITAMDGSYEETPPTLIDFIVRDRRWCRGNLQHLGVVTGAGYHPVSRFHLLHGIMNYLASPLWLFFLVMGAVIANNASMGIMPDGDTAASEWFHGHNIHTLTLITMTLIILLTPKILSVIYALTRSPQSGHQLQRSAVVIGTLIEASISAIIAPILMLQQSMAILRACIGLDSGWSPQNRKSSTQTLWITCRFHGLESVIGLTMIAGIFAGFLTPWLAPIAVSLLLSVPLSLFCALPLYHVLARFLMTPETAQPPQIDISAQKAKTAIARALV